MGYMSNLPPGVSASDIPGNEFEVTLNDAIRLFKQKLREEQATPEDVLAVSALLPSLIPLCRALTNPDE